MKEIIGSCAARMTARVQDLGAHFDPEVLMLPGGSVIAVALWLYGHRPHAHSRRADAPLNHSK
jgi:hypothetical protein